MAVAVLRFEAPIVLGHRFGHSFVRTECEQTFTDVRKIPAFSRVVRRKVSFGTRGRRFKSCHSDHYLAEIENYESGGQEFESLRARQSSR